MENEIKQRIMRLILVYVAVFSMLLLFGQCARASETSVDIVSKDSKTDIIRITIDNCTTDFEIDKSKLTALLMSDSALNELALKAKKRAESGCK